MDLESAGAHGLALYSRGVTSNADNEWLGVTCDSDEWPYSMEIPVFEARRAVGQIVRSLAALTRSSTTDSIGGYLMSTNLIDKAIDTIRADLVSEARTRGLTWKAIGRFLGVGAKAAQNRFGAGLEQERQDQLREEARTIRMTTKASTVSYEGPETEQLGGTPAERIAYAYHLIDGAKTACRNVEDQLTASEPDFDSITGQIHLADRKIRMLGLMMLGDQAQWDAVIEWAGQPGNPGHANYYAPATYLYLAMCQITQCAFYFICMLNQERPDFIQSMEYFIQASKLLDNVILLLNRDDVRSILPPSTVLTETLRLLVPDE